MNRRELTHVVAVVGLAILARILLFNEVGVWGDFGFYTYDARLILEGQRPFIDFLGRSPLFLYAYAAVRGVVGEPVRLLRVFIYVWWFLTAVPVYLIARRVGSHRVAVVAIALFLLTPFSLAYHSWANTQAMAAFFVTWAIYVTMTRDGVHWYALVGALLGLGFLARRSVVVVGAALVAWSFVRVYRDEYPRSFAVAHVGTVALSAALTLSGAYFLLAGFDVSVTRELFVTHALNLVLSVGRGGYPLLGVDAPPVTNRLTSGRIPIFNDLCQLCGVWTAKTFAKTILVASPFVAPLVVYVRDWADDPSSSAGRQYLGGILLTLAAYAVVQALLAGFVVRVVAVVGLVAVGVAAFRASLLDRDRLYSREMLLLLFVLTAFSLGYLYRNRFLHTYYFADFVPLLSIVAAVCWVSLFRRLDIRWRSVVTVAVACLVVTSLLAAHPITVIMLSGNEAGWFTMNSIPQYAEDLDERVDENRTVWTGHPTYVAGSDARLAGDVSRGHYLVATFRDDDNKLIGPAATYYDRTVIPGLRSGRIQYVIHDKMTHRMIRWSPAATRLFERNYCRVDSAEQLYDRTNATLYRYADVCETSRPTVVSNFTHT